MSVTGLLLAPFRKVRDLQALRASVRPLYPRTCPICSYHGTFRAFGRPPRLDALCANCGSLERHRLFWLWFGKNRDRLKGPFIHFAPEQVLERKFRRLFTDYRTSDFLLEADLALNLEDIDLPDGSVGTIMCNHVLEHVDDRRAMRELCRILKPDGIAILSVPLVEGWDNTYECKEAVSSGLLREVHFGQDDHVRYYGRDFRNRLRDAGFSRVEEFTAEGADVITYGLLRGEKVFLCSGRDQDESREGSCDWIHAT